MYLKETFDPYNIKQEDMDRLANAFERYLDELERVMVIPDDIMKEHGKEIEVSIKEMKGLIKKLRKGDTSVFKDPDEWNMLV